MTTELSCDDLPLGLKQPWRAYHLDEPEIRRIEVINNSAGPNRFDVFTGFVSRITGCHPDDVGTIVQVGDVLTVAPPLNVGARKTSLRLAPLVCSQSPIEWCGPGDDAA